MTARGTLDEWMASRLAEVAGAGLLREPWGRGRPAPEIADLSTNDYLGLRGHRVSRETAPGGAGASRLLGGDHEAHHDLEQSAAEWVGAAAALVFSSGFAANLGLLAALSGPDVLIISDAANHASLIDGCRLSRARTRVVPHLSTARVAEALREPAVLRVVVVESYYSMDADTPDLGTLRALCDAEGAALVVDEAHALGVFGPEGRGILRERGVRADIVIGTFSKALGAQGAFIAGSETLRTLLWNRARSFVFSTGLSPALAAHARENLSIARGSAPARAHLAELATAARVRLLDAGLDARGHGPIVPVVVGSPERASRAAAWLERDGIRVCAVRPPTVPVGTSRLRLGLHAGLTRDALDRCLEGVIAACRG